MLFRPETERRGDVLITIFLRGGMDGLHTVPPHADPYFRSAATKHSALFRTRQLRKQIFFGILSPFCNQPTLGGPRLGRGEQPSGKCGEAGEQAGSVVSEVPEIGLRQGLATTPGTDD